MYNVPVKEIEILQEGEYSFEGFDANKASGFLQQFKDAVSIRIRTTIKLSHATDAGLNLNGQTLFKYDMNYNLINGMFYSPDDRTSMEISADIIIDKTSIEVFVDGGAFSYAIERKADPKNQDGFKFFGNTIEVKSLTVYPMRSIWTSTEPN